MLIIGFFFLIDKNWIQLSGNFDQICVSIYYIYNNNNYVIAHFLSLSNKFSLSQLLSSDCLLCLQTRVYSPRNSPLFEP